MSQGRACLQRPGHQPRWRVTAREYNVSAFNGGRRTPSAYSEVVCLECRCRWRTRAGYVGGLPDITATETTAHRAVAFPFRPNG